jgi:hypothetical protein
MLSRGKGVPEATRSAYQDIRALLERQRDAGTVTRLYTQRIGLEGELRLCVEFKDPDLAREALTEIHKRSDGVELLNVSAVPCPSPKEGKP